MIIDEKCCRWIRTITSYEGILITASRLENRGYLMSLNRVSHKKGCAHQVTLQQHIHLSAPNQIRTDTLRILSPFSLPIGVQEHIRIMNSS